VFVVTASVPVVRGFSPLQGHVGATVTITGSWFTGATGVSFHGTPATVFSVVSDGTITAQVPAGATSGRVSVTTPAGTGTSAAGFTVLPAVAPAPVISGFTPASGMRGIRVTINGSGFMGATAVTFNGVRAAFTVVSDSRIVATVPPLARTGHITVTTPGGTATSAGLFSV
jgi:hypothetical protein